MNMRWIGRTTGGSSIKVPLDAPSNVVAEIDDGQVSLTWKDPPDKYAANEGGGASGDAVLVSQWAYTRVVRKQGSAPESVNDGVLICESSVRDQYATSPFVDSQVENDVLYYYGLYAFTTTGIVSEGAIISATPHAGVAISTLAEGTLIKILESGTPVEFYLAKHNYERGLNGAGRELMVRKNARSQRVWDADKGLIYNGSDIDVWCNGSYKNLLDARLQSLIGTTKFYVRESNASNTLITLERSVFILSATELGNTYKPLEGSELPIADQLSTSGFDQWTRRAEELNAVYCADNGRFFASNPQSALGGRPCFTLPSTAEVDQNMNLMLGNAY